MELDNNIGTYNYDIANLRETQRQIKAVSKAKETPIADNVRQEFIDNLLNIYEELESSFSKQLYSFYKGFEFRSLWNMDKKMAKFQSRAATLTKGSGYLQGVTSLTKALLEIENIEMAARRCFTSKKPKIGIHKWSFDKTKDPTRELFTHMNVWTTFMYWPESYPRTPEDCGIQKRNATVEPEAKMLDPSIILRRDAEAN